MEDFSKLKEKHLTAKCPQHNLKITSVVKVPDGSQQFLCKLCKIKTANDKTYYIADILDEEVTATIQEKIQNQTKDSEAIDDKHKAFFQFLDQTIDDLRKEFDRTLNEAQEKIKKKFMGYVAEKKGQSTNWVDIKHDFDEKQQAYLRTEPLTSSPELVKFLEAYEKTMECLQNNIEQQNVEDYEVNREEITKFRKSVEKQAEILAEKLIRFNFSHLSIKIDAIKEESVVNTGHKGVFKALTVLDDLNMFATGSTDGEMGLWDSYSLTQIAKFKAHKNYISSLLYIPNKKVLISASLDRTIKVFEVSDRKIKSDDCVTLTGHKSFIYGLCYLEDQNKFVSIGHEPEIKIWDLDTLKLDSTISTNGWASDSYEVAYIKDEGLIGVVGKDIIRLYSLSSKSLVHEIKTGGLSIQSIQYLPKHKAFVAAVERGKIRVWSIAGGTVNVERDIVFEDVGDTPYTILALEDQNVLAVTTRSKFVCFINFNNGTLVKKGTPLKDGIAIAFLKKQGKIIVADNSSEKVAVFGL